MSECPGCGRNSLITVKPGNYTCEYCWRLWRVDAEGKTWPRRLEVIDLMLFEAVENAEGGEGLDGDS
jgi:hypothetical protein